MPEYSFKLFVSGKGDRSERAIRDVRNMCEQRFRDACELSVIDVNAHPEQAAERNILATPTLVRDFPGPSRRVVGDFSDFDQVEAGLGLAVRAVSNRRTSQS